MLPTTTFRRTRAFYASLGSALIALLALTACSGSDGKNGTDGQNAVPPLTQGDQLPGFAVDITSVTGGTGPGGNLKVGDKPKVNFTVQNATTGESIPPTEWAFGEVLFSGPTSNYQLIVDQSDLAATVKTNNDGSFTYQLPAIPAQVPDQLNFTGMAEGDLKYQTWLVGQNLPDGTYTVAISARKDYEVQIDGNPSIVERDAGTDTMDVLFGAATVLEPREIVSDAVCSRCHGVVRAHGENRYSVKNCVLCHTSGAEDPNPANVPADNPGTPGRAIKFSTMIHKIHNGHALPSVNGIGVKTDGSRDYTVTPVKNQIVGYRNSVHDFSDVFFPPWPGTIGMRGMPRDSDYSDPATNKSAQSATQTGVFNCVQCHGDPDGPGGVEPPAQGAEVYQNPTRDNCIQCHDDWNPELPYQDNVANMPPVANDGGCANCHVPSGNEISVMDAHIHPMLKQDPYTIGLTASIDAVRDVNGNADGKLDPGESVEVDMTIADRNGAAVDPTVLEGFAFDMDGPRAGPNSIYYFESRSGWFYGSGPMFTLRVPDNRLWEEGTTVVAASTATEGVTVDRVVTGPIQDLGAATVANTYARTINPGSSAADVPLAAAAAQNQGYVTVAPAAVLGFTAGDIVRIDPNDGTHPAYYAVASSLDAATGTIELTDLSVSGVRFRRVGSQPAFGLTTSSVIRPVGPTSALGTITVTAVNPATNTVTLGADPGTDAVLISYVTDYTVPTNYPGSPLSGSPVNLAAGEWTGLPLVAGGYEMRFYAWRRFYVDPTGAITMTAPASTNSNTDYAESTPPTTAAITVGDSSESGYSSPIPATETCYSCHTDLQFHSGVGTRHGFDTCLMCHGQGGAEGGGQSVEFRSLIHSVHADAFPWFEGGIADCESCHGAGSDSWKEPVPRDYPGATGAEMQDASWNIVCTSCHSDTATAAHAQTNTSGGLEACATCHGPDRPWAVEVMHSAR